MRHGRRYLAVGRRRGASLLSYGLVVGLIAVVAIAAVSSMGGAITGLFGGAGDSMDIGFSGGSSGSGSSAGCDADSADGWTHAALSHGGTAPGTRSPGEGAPPAHASAFDDSAQISCSDGVASAGSVTTVATACDVNYTVVLGACLDSEAPALVLISGTGGPYATGATITVTLSANEPLLAAGAPSLSLLVGAAARTAAFSAVNSGAAEFTYVVQAGDSDDDGVDVTALTAASGELTDAEANDLNATAFTFPVNLGINVNQSCAANSAGGGWVHNAIAGGSTAPGSLSPSLGSAPSNASAWIDVTTVSCTNGTASLGTITQAATACNSGYTLQSGACNDITAPVLLSFTRYNPSTTTTDSNTLVFQATFDSAVTGVNGTDFSVTGSTATVTAVSGGPSIYDLTVSGGNLPSFEGTVGLLLVTGHGIADLAANPLPDTQPATSQTYTLDQPAPIAFALGSSSTETAAGIAKDSGGGYYVVGTTNQGGTNDIAIAHFNSAGDFDWGKRIGGTGDDQGRGVVAVGSDAIIQGSTNSAGAGNTDIALIRIQSDGSITWVKTIGTGNSDNPGGIVLNGGNIGITGFTGSGSTYSILISSISTSGTTVNFTRTFSGGGTNYGEAISTDGGTGFVVTGLYQSGGPTAASFAMIRVNSDGTTSSPGWMRILNLANYDRGQAICPDGSGGFMLGGFTTSAGLGTQAALMRLNSDGTINWSRTLGGGVAELAYAITQDNSGGFVFTGEAQSVGGGGSDLLMARFTSGGTLSWAGTLGGTGFESGAVVAPDGTGVMVAGRTASYGAGGDDMMIARYESGGTLPGVTARFDWASPTVTTQSWSNAAWSPSVSSPTWSTANWSGYTSAAWSPTVTALP
jgi:Flp pilus assembly pilin Flp